MLCALSFGQKLTNFGIKNKKAAVLAEAYMENGSVYL